MRKILFVSFLFLSVILNAQNIDFNTFFENKTLRFDYYHTGNHEQEFITVNKLYRLDTWAGTARYCIQPFELGSYSAKVYDLASNQLIYSYNFSTIFSEYQTTGMAREGQMRTYHETVLVPFPKQKIKLVIEKRDRKNDLFPIFSTQIDPADYSIITETPKIHGSKVYNILVNGKPQEKVDLLIIGDGYTEKEQAKFKKDLQYFTDLFFTVEPYQSRKNDINIRGIFVPSDESGVDEPRQERYKNTYLNSSFNIFGTDRYLLAEDNEKVRDIASRAPYDALLIMVNSKRYGGGGIYRWQTVFTANSEWHTYVFLHEFGHAFAGLGDEYYSKEVSYEDFYPQGIEPLDPNITRLLNPPNVKWKEYLSPGIEVPTPWGKEIFDSLNLKVSELTKMKVEKIHALKNSNVSDDEIKSVEDNYNASIKSVNNQIDDFLLNHPLRDKTGVFEGAGYLSTGMYRSSINSLMLKFEKYKQSYNIVSESAINKMIDYYSGK